MNKIQKTLDKRMKIIKSFSKGSKFDTCLCLSWRSIFLYFSLAKAFYFLGVVFCCFLFVLNLLAISRKLCNCWSAIYLWRQTYNVIIFWCCKTIHCEHVLEVCVPECHFPGTRFLPKNLGNFPSRAFRNILFPVPT